VTAVPRHFTNWLKTYMQYTRDSEAPDTFHFWTGVSTIAGALQRQVWIDMRKWQWVPNFYIIFVGPPGIVTKSTTIGAGFALLERVPGINFGPESVTWQALGESLEEASRYVKYRDAGSGEELVVSMSAVTLSLSELGTFLVMEDSKFVSVLVDLWDGKQKPFKHRTRHSKLIEIQNPWLNIIACTTPSWLRVNFPASAIGGGLTSRIIFVYGSAKRQFIAYPDEIIESAEYYDLEKKLVDDLVDISLIAGPLTLTSEARQWGRKWYLSHWETGPPPHMASERYAGYLSRKQTHIHKLAIVLSAAQSSDKQIKQNHLEEAEMLLSQVEPDMLKVFESVGMVDEARHVAELSAFVRVHGFLTADQLWRLCSNTMESKQFEIALTAAVRGNTLSIVTRENRRGLVFNRESHARPD
jgi:hypothetical protein